MSIADHRRDRPRTRFAHKGSRRDVGDAGRAGEPSRARTRAALSADRRDCATVGGDREIARAAVGGPGPDDVHSGLGAHGAGASIEARRRRPRRADEVAARAALEVSRQPIPLAQRQIGGAGETIEYVGLADTAERMHAAYPAVVEFLDAVDRVNSLVAEKLAPTRKRLDAAGTVGPKEIAELLAVSATDPLSLTTRDVEKRIAAIADSVEQRSAELAELAAIQSNWPDAVATTAQRLDELRDANTRATEIRAHAVAKGARGLLSGARRRRTGACAPSYGPSPHPIRRRFGRFATGSRRRCELAREERSSSRRACSTVAAS